MDKKLPYLFGFTFFSLLTVASIEYWPGYASLSSTLVAMVEKKPKKGEALCATMMYPVLLNQICDRWDLKGAATYEMIAVQAGEIATLTADRTNSIYPVSSVGVEPQTQFDWGFKLSLGYRFDDAHMKLRAEYNYLKQIVNTSLQTSYGQGFAPSNYTNIAIEEGSGPQRLFNNLETGNYTLLNNLRAYGFRPSLVTQNLEMTTMFGLEANFIQRRQKSVFSDDIPQDGISLYPKNLGAYLQNYQKITWWGVGPSVGVHTRWHILDDCSIFGDAYGGLTYGLSTSRTATASLSYLQNQTYSAKEASVQNEMYQYAPTFRYLLGVNYIFLSPSMQTQLEFDLAYETCYYADVMKTVVPNCAFRSENGSGLGTQGVVLQVGFTF